MTAFFLVILLHDVPDKEQCNSNGDPSDDPDDIALFTDLLFFFDVF